MDYVNVRQDTARLKEMLKLSGGVREVPVIEDGGRVAIGYDGGS